MANLFFSQPKTTMDVTLAEATMDVGNDDELIARGKRILGTKLEGNTFLVPFVISSYASQFENEALKFDPHFQRVGQESASRCKPG